jgi:hypothetical protein
MPVRFLCARCPKASCSCPALMRHPIGRNGQTINNWTNIINNRMVNGWTSKRLKQTRFSFLCFSGNPLTTVVSPVIQSVSMFFHTLWWSFALEPGALRTVSHRPQRVNPLPTKWPHGAKGRQCFSTPFGGAFAWSLMRFGRCLTVLKGLTLCRRSSLPRDNRRQCFFPPFDGALCWSLMRLGRCPTVLKGLMSKRSDFF